VKSRSGNLAGIIHPYFGQLHGFGHYAQNFYGVGSFQFRSGRQIETAVEIAEGLSRTTMQKTMYALTEETNYLKNGTFTEEMMYWDCENSVSPVTVGGQLLMHNRSLSTIKVRVATMTEYGGRNMLRLKDSYVRQANEHIRKPEPYEEEVTTIDEETGEEVTETKRRLPKLYLSFRMICREAGTLTVGFKGAGKATGEEDEGQEPMPFTVQGIGAGNEAEPVTYTFEGTWDGEGDFLLSFTGDAYIDQLAITGKPLEEFKVQVSTKFEQTAERITMEGKRIDEANKAIGVVGLELNALDTSLTLYAQRTDNLENTVGSVGIRLDGMENSLTLHAGRIDNLNSTIGSVSLRLDGVDSSLSVTASRVNRIDGDVAGLTGKVNQILSAGYITRPEGNLMWASKEYENGAKIISTINQTAEEVYIKADKIKLEGVVTANNYFRINLDGSIDVNVGRIGGFEIAYGRIGAVASANGTPAFGSLAIYDDFFRVGGANGYVMFGDDVIPAVAGGAFTAVGRIVNKAPNTGAQWGFSTANYGLFIDVTGGTTNYGIQSNAPLMAPAFINTRLKRVTFGTGSYSLDFSQAFIFLAYASTAVNIILPDEAAIRRMFNVSSLPSDFGYYFIITADHGTRRFTLTDVYNHDGNLHNWDFEQGDTAIVLIKKYPTFRYQMLSYRYNQ
jgi:archaellum component FlaC